MGLLENGLSEIPGLKNAFVQNVSQPTFVTNDYPDGFVIREFQNGQELVKDKVVLKGPFMPHQPFTFGGEQRVVTEYYPGNSEPAVQVFGPKEDDLTIKGHLRLKGLKRTGANDPKTDMRNAALQYQQLIDAMRVRGNLVYMQMGSWQRWGFVKSCKFDLKTVAEISYEITFTAVMFNKPLNCKLNKTPQKDLIQPNKDLTNAALAAISAMQTFPKSMPRSLSDLLNQEIAKAAGYINLVTNFTNSVLSSVEQLEASANRALGLIKNARSQLSQAIRRMQAIPVNVAYLAKDAASQPKKTVAQLESANHIALMKYNYTALSVFLAALAGQFRALEQSVPQRRILVKQGDTLQKLSSKYYGTPDNWDKIYQHNNLSSTTLQAGTIIEIPKV